MAKLSDATGAQSPPSITLQRADFTFKHNRKQGRHGWLRLTPAYSIKIVTEILGRLPSPGRVLDPFSGTGTTGLVCAERGLELGYLADGREAGELDWRAIGGT